MLYKLSYPFSEPTSVETDVFLHNLTWLHKCAHDVCMTFTATALSLILLFVSIFLEYVIAITL